MPANSNHKSRHRLGFVLCFSGKHGHWEQKDMSNFEYCFSQCKVKVFPAA